MTGPKPGPQRTKRTCPGCGLGCRRGACTCWNCGEQLKPALPGLWPSGPLLTRQQVRELPGLRFDSIGGAMLLVAATALVCACLASRTIVGLGVFLAAVTAWFVVLVQGTRKRGSPVDLGRALKLLISSAVMGFFSVGAGCIGFFGTCTATLMTTRVQSYGALGIGLMVGAVGFVIAVGLSFPLFIRLFKINVRSQESDRPESSAAPKPDPDQTGEAPR